MSNLRPDWTHVDDHPVFARIGTMQAGRPTAVLVHGLVVSSRYLVPTAELLARRCNVAVPDLPGWGRSAGPDHVLDVPELADVLDGWMAMKRIERAVLLGNSMGCQIIADIAARRPARVAGIILVGPTIDPAARNPIISALRQLRLMWHEAPSLIGVIAADLLDMGPGRAVRTSYLCLRDRIEEKLPRIAAPALVVRGERDRHVPQAWAEEVTRLLPRGRLEVVSGAAHVVNYTRPAALVELALPFIRDCWRD